MGLPLDLRVTAPSRSWVALAAWLRDKRPPGRALTAVDCIEGALKEPPRREVPGPACPGCRGPGVPSISLEGYLDCSNVEDGCRVVTFASDLEMI